MSRIQKIFLFFHCTFILCITDKLEAEQQFETKMVYTREISFKINIFHRFMKCYTIDFFILSLSL